MTGFFTSILDNLVCWIETACIDVLNLLIVAVGALLSALYAILPDMPSLPALPTQVTNGFAYVEYFFPLDWFFAEFTVFMALAFAWFLVAVPLRWAKGVRANQ